jgi:hypothetical protein
MLNPDMELRNKYNGAIQNRYNAVEKTTTIDDQWEMLKESEQQVPLQYIPKIGKIRHREIMTEDIL